MRDQPPSLRGAVSLFAEELRGTVQQLTDGASYLSRAVQHKPCVGPREFREVLSDLQDEMAELTTEVEVLERFTVDAISFEELLGHCLALYQANRGTIQLLEAHLHQYGYQPPPGVPQEPEDPVAAAAAARRQGTVADRAAHDDDDDSEGEDEPCHEGAVASSRAAQWLAQANGDQGPAGGARTVDRYGWSAAGGGKQTLAATPGHRSALPSAPATRPSGRKATPGSKARGHLASSDDEDRDGSDGEEAGGATAGMALLQQHRRPGVPGAAAHVPTGAMSSKGHILAATQAASFSAALAAAASVRASARKAPRPSSPCSRASATPEAMMLSPSMAQLLARYNPPSDGDARLPLSSPTAAKSGAGRSTPGSEEVTTALAGLAPFGGGQRGAPPAAAAAAVVPPPQQQQHAAPPPRQLAPAPLQVPLAPQASSGSEDDTCSLYAQLIKSRDVPSSLSQAPPQQQQRPAQQQQPQGQQQPSRVQPVANAAAAAAPAAAGGAAGSKISFLRSPSAPPVRAATAVAAAAATPLPADGASPPAPAPRSVTPRSVARADWQQHDKVLAEKMAGLERAWVESGQAALTPLRKSWAGNGAGSVGGAVAAALERARSPAPSRAVAQAAAAAAATMLGQQRAGGAAGAAAAGPQPGRGRAAAEDGMEGADEVRVLSPVQEPAARRDGVGAGARAAAIPVRSGWEAADASGVSTVVGATTATTPGRDAAAGGRSAAGVKPRGTPGKAAAGGATPGKAGRDRRPVSPLAVALTPARGGGAVTPGRTTRATAAAAPAAAVGAVAGTRSRATPMRTSWGTGLAAAAEAEAAAQGGATAASRATPGRVARPAVAAEATAAAPNRTPGRVRCAEPLWPEGAEPARQPAGRGIPQLTLPSRVSPPPPPQQQQQPARAAAAAAVPQLRIPTCDSWGSGGGSEDAEPGDWRGFPLSRTGAATAAAATAAAAPAATVGPAAGASDDVSLALPPGSVRSGTPKALTPGRGAAVGGGGGGHAGIPVAPGAAAARPVGAAALAGLSPGTSQLLSRALGEDFMGQLRPQQQQPAAPLGSRIPVPSGTAPSPRPNATAAAAVPARPAPAAAAPAVPAVPSSASGGATVAAAGGCADVAARLGRPCAEEDWCTLPPRTQQAFPLETVNSHLRTLAAVVAGRPPTAPGTLGGTFSVSDVTALSAAFTTTAAKLFINTLAKLGRCEAAGCTLDAGQLYRLCEL